MERPDKSIIAALYIFITNAAKINFKELEYDDVEWINLAQDSY